MPPFHPENKAYEVRVSNEVVLAHIKAKAAHCDSEARLESKNGPPTYVAFVKFIVSLSISLRAVRPSNWSLNVGSNVLRYYIVDLSHTDIWVLSQYIVQIVREDLTASEAEFDPSSSHQVCSLVQVSPKGESLVEMRHRIQIFVRNAISSCFRGSDVVYSRRRLRRGRRFGRKLTRRL